MSEDLHKVTDPEVSPNGAHDASDQPSHRHNHHGMSPETLAAASRVLGRLATGANRSSQFEGEHG
jgi:hypothetical protein